MHFKKNILVDRGTEVDVPVIMSRHSLLEWLLGITQVHETVREEKYDIAEVLACPCLYFVCVVFTLHKLSISTWCPRLVLVLAGNEFDVETSLDLVGMRAFNDCHSWV